MISNPPDDVKQPAMNTIAAAEYLTRVAGRRYTVSTLETYRSRNRGPAYYKSLNGQAVLYRPADLDTFAAVQRIEPQPETHSQ